MTFRAVSRGVSGTLDRPDRSPQRDAAGAEFPQPFGRYTLLGRLGAGGMADALLAMLQGTMGFQKPVVIKRMHASLGRDSHFVKMFLDEARLAARLSHANVVGTSEVGECDGHYFIAMEYLEGVSLDRVARSFIHEGGEIPLGLLLRVLCDCLDGLHYAHELRDFDGTPLGVVHRDVTPSNLFVTTGGVSKVLDFGIAKASTQDEATRTGMLKGKLAYMSPEQFYDAPIDRRSDVWSMGVVVWEMVTGRRLFKGSNDAVTYRNIMTAEIPPVGTYRRDAPSSIDAVIANALARDRNHRYASADAMRRALDDVLRAQLGGVTHGDVATVILERFGPVLDESRRALRDFAHKRPDRRDDDDEVPTQINSRGALQVPIGFVPMAPGNATEPDPFGGDDEEEGAGSTVVDAKLPPELAALAASIPRPVTIPAARAQSSPAPLAPAQPITTPPALSSAPPAMASSAPPMYAPQPHAVLSPRPPDAPYELPHGGFEARPPYVQGGAFPQPPAYAPQPPAPFVAPPSSRAGAALGWIVLLALLGAVGVGVYTQREHLARGLRELASGEAPDPLRVGTFQLVIVSVPSGARVFEGTRDLGPTPLEIPVLRGSVADHPRTFTFRLEGYATASAAVGSTLAARAELRVPLSAVPRR